jgi:ribonuclease P protein component
MISVRHRFHGYGSLRGVYNRGQTVRGSFISLKFTDRDDQRVYRAAVVVSRKVHKSAVVRNRIRRRIYEIIRRSDTSLTVHKDLVFTVFSEQVATLEQPKLIMAIEQLLRKAGEKHPTGPQTSVRHGIVDKQPKKKEN